MSDSLQFADALALAFCERFGRHLQTEFNIFAGRLVTTLTDGGPMTSEEHDFIRAFEADWLAAQSFEARRGEAG